MVTDDPGWNPGWHGLVFKGMFHLLSMLVIFSSGCMLKFAICQSFVINAGS